MTIIEEYKQQMFESVMLMYNGKFNPEKLKHYIDSICETKLSNKRALKANCRNLYQYNYHMVKDPNYIPVEIKEDDLNVLSNGLLTEPQDPASSKIIINWMDSRDVYKKEMLKAREAGNSEKFLEFNNKQNKVKANTNSIYGASTMPTSYVSNVDMGGAITAQARNFISEQVWAIERFLGQNFAFENINELYLWIKKLFEIKLNLFNTETLKYIDYIPTVEDCLHKFVIMTRNIKNFRKNIKDMHKTNFLFFETMSEEKRIAFYYANNPIEFIARNSRIAKIVYSLIISDIEFINPYSIPDGLKDEITELLYAMKTFVIVNITVMNRVDKFKYNKRKVCVIGDTDSTMPSLYQPVLDTLRIFGKEELINDEKVEIRLTMTYAVLLSGLLDECCLNYVKTCNSYREGGRFFMYMKNEIFFPIVLLFPVKKNYIGIQTIQEGKLIPEDMQLAITGALLGSSGLNEYVSTSIIDLIVNHVAKAKVYDPLPVVRGVHKIQDHITKEIKAGNKEFGIYARFNGVNNIKDPERTATVRASCIWNNIYPDDYIVPGDAVYLFDTSLQKEEDLDLIDPKFNDIKERIRNAVFRPVDGLDFSRFGLKTFAIPAQGDTVSIPEWIIPFIVIGNMVEKHLQPITTLYSSLLLSPCQYVSETTNTKKMGISTLIQF